MEVQHLSLPYLRRHKNRATAVPLKLYHSVQKHILRERERERENAFKCRAYNHSENTDIC